MALGEKERLLKEVEKEREVWRQRDRALALVLREKEALINYLEEEQEHRRKDVKVIICMLFLTHFYSFSLIFSADSSELPSIINSSCSSKEGAAGIIFSCMLIGPKLTQLFDGLPWHFCADIHGPQRINPGDLDDPLNVF